MGAAKLRRNAFAQMVIRETERWAFPISEEENSISAELLTLDQTIVPRVDSEQLSAARMKSKECHANTSFYADNDPTGRTDQVFGWWVQEEVYVLHSVIRQNGRLICITPQMDGDEEPFTFIVDSLITWRANGNFKDFYRGSWRIPVGVRKNPRSLIEKIREVQAMLRAGMDPYVVIMKALSHQTHG